jgi:hypothetical protein
MVVKIIYVFLWANFVGTGAARPEPAVTSRRPR